MSQVAFFKTDTDEIVMTFWFFQIMPKTLNPQWREQFDFHLYEERGGIIDITAWDKDAGKRDDFIGRFVQLGIFDSS